MFAPYGCGKLIGYARTIATKKYTAHIARHIYTQDAVKYDGNFGHLFDSIHNSSDEVLAF